MILIFDALKKWAVVGYNIFPSKKPNNFLNIEQEFHHEINQLHSACHTAALLQMCISTTKVIMYKCCNERVYKRKYDIWTVSAVGQYTVHFLCFFNNFK